MKFTVSDKYKITCDLFSLPYRDGLQVLYAPRLGFVCSANEPLIDLLAHLDSLDSDALTSEQRSALAYLTEKGVLNGTPPGPLTPPNPGPFTPTMTTLFSTNQCNLRCRYCYASAGDRAPLTMDWRYATAAVYLIIQNAAEKGHQAAQLGFHGGGEPLLPWKFIQNIVRYAQELCDKAGLRLLVHAATNGLLSQRQLEWIIVHFQGLNISFDGLPDIQDRHRPLPNGMGSFEFVDKTLRFLDERGFNYGLRSTISAFNVERMEESLDFIAHHYKVRRVHFEPLFLCGRCRTSDDLNPDLKSFSENFQQCETRCADYKIVLTYSGCRIETLTDSFCGVSRDNFSVTPDGYITACYEVTSRDDPKSETFFIGRINDQGQLEINEAKRRFLQSLKVENLNFCQDCFAKWHCAGDCAAKLDHTDYAGPRGHDRCRLNRELTAHRIIALLEGTNYPGPMRPVEHATNHTGEAP